MSANTYQRMFRIAYPPQVPVVLLPLAEGRDLTLLPDLRLVVRSAVGEDADFGSVDLGVYYRVELTTTEDNLRREPLCGEPMTSWFDRQITPRNPIEVTMRGDTRWPSPATRYWIRDDGSGYVTGDGAGDAECVAEWERVCAESREDGMVTNFSDRGEIPRARMDGVTVVVSCNSCGALVASQDTELHSLQHADAKPAGADGESQ